MAYWIAIQLVSCALRSPAPWGVGQIVRGFPQQAAVQLRLNRSAGMANLERESILGFAGGSSEVRGRRMAHRVNAHEHKDPTCWLHELEVAAVLFGACFVT